VDAAAFANRTGRLETFDRELAPIVERSLGSYGSGGWHADIVEGAAVLFLELFEKDAGTSFTTSGILMGFQREIRDALDKTTDPGDQVTGDKVRVVTEWVSTFTANAAAHRAGVARRTPGRRWVARDDPRVRPAHAVLDGTVMPWGEKFDVDGAKLRWPGDPVGDPKGWIRCRCLTVPEDGGADYAVHDTNSLGGNSMTAAATVPVDDPEVQVTDLAEVDDVADADDVDVMDDIKPVPFYGVLAPVGVESGDGRKFKSLTHRDLPLPLAWQELSSEGHAGSVVVGRIDTIVPGEDGLVRYTGEFRLSSPEADKAISQVADGSVRGVSVDVDDYEVEIDEAAFRAAITENPGRRPVETANARVAGATIVPIPAFPEAFIALGEAPAEYQPKIPAGDDEDLPTDEDIAAVQEEAEAIVASATFAPGTKDGPGWITEPDATSRLRKYWVKGAGALKIKWGVDGDFDRCRMQLGKYVNPAFLNGTCANLHKVATGVWPGRQNGRFDTELEGEAAPSMSLVASGAPQTLEASWFRDPKLDGPTPLTITEDGRVYGHLATFDTCHIGVQGKCQTPPHSATGYAYFQTGLVETNEGDVPVGRITMGTGHAGLRLRTAAAMAHYDNTGTAVANVAAGEDAYGIWVAGAMRDRVTEEQRKELKASALSGDWRERGGSFELVGALAVNVAGFPIPRIGQGATAGRQISLVASGIVEQVSEYRPSVQAQQQANLVAAVADELEHRQEQKLAAAARTARLAAVREASASIRTMRLQALRQLE
jgi:hypothetical protein